jgi:RNA polymerase sigma factor (sigma-70 family)
MESWKQTLAELAAGRGVALKRQAFLLCGDDAKADDLVQEALIRAFARPLRAPRRDTAEAYVRAIMVNVFIDGVRRSSRWTRTAPLLRTAELGPDPADEVVARNTMLEALSGLSPQQRACVVLRYYEDLPVAAVATVLGVAEGTVKRHLSDALTRMSGRLSAADGADGADGADAGEAADAAGGGEQKKGAGR